MPSIDFSCIEEAQGLVPVPAGKYRVEVADVEETASQAGNEMWNISLRILEGEHEGRVVFDRLVFIRKAMPRVKLFCARLGLDVAASVDLVPAMLLDRTCLLTVEISKYTAEDGTTREANKVPWAGFEFDPGPSTSELPEAADGSVV